MADTSVSSPAESAPPDPQARTSRRPRRRKRFTAAIVLFVVFVLLVALSVWLYPRRGIVDRPAPFALTMISAAGPEIGAFDIVPLAVVAGQGYEDRSGVGVVVAPAGADLYTVHVTWTYSPALCAAGTDPAQAAFEGCGPASPPYRTAGSEVEVTLPVGATFVHCGSCQGPGPFPLHKNQGILPERDVQVRPLVTLPDAGELTSSAQPIAEPVTASWSFEIRDTSFAWAANGLSAEGSLPIVSFQDIDNVGYGTVTVHYRIPGGGAYDWNDGPDPDRLTWSEPVGAASTAVQVAGIDNDASASDTRDVLIVGILLGAAGGALIGAIQEIAHAESDGTGEKRRRS